MQRDAGSQSAASPSGPPGADAPPRRSRPREDGSWTNWSGSVRFSPAEVARPRDEAELARLVRRAREERQNVRVVGAGHSSSRVVETRDVLVSLERMQGVLHHDVEAAEATLRGGMTIAVAGRELLRRGLMMPNWGDVDYQTVAGAIATGTHGSGLRLTNLATMLVGGRMVTGEGEAVDLNEPHLARMARCSLGSLGIMTELRLRLMPAYKLRRQEWCMPIDACLEQLDGLAEACRSVDFYWYPRTDAAKVRIANPLDAPLPPVRDARLVTDKTDWGNRIVPQSRLLKFDELEYALPARAGTAAFGELRARVKAVHRRSVGWRVLYRFVAPDDAPLSEAYGRETVTVSCHHNAGLPFWDYFLDAETIFRRHVGRPHWGKKHTLGAEELRPLYPEWNGFMRTRQRLDPDGVLLSPYMRELLGVRA